MKKILSSLFIALLALGALAYTKRPVYTAATTYIEVGRCVSSADGLITNTFAITYSSAPKVLISNFGTNPAGTNAVRSVTTTNCVIYTTIGTVTNDLIIVGTPQ